MTGGRRSERPPGVPAEAGPVYAWFARHSFFMDGVLAAVLWSLLVLPLLWEFAALGWPDGPLHAAFYSFLVVPLAWRRRSPLPVGCLITAGYLAQVVLGLPLLPANLTVFWVIYALAAFGPRWSGVVALLLGFAGAATAILVYSIGGIELTGRGGFVQFFIYWIVIGAFLGISWLTGDLTRARRLLLTELQTRTHRLEMERKQERDLAAADERERIAREMHDIVAHSLSVMITQADGARYIAKTDAGAAERALKTIADTGRESLGEMRRLLGVLRAEDDSPTRPVPTLADVDDLVHGLRDAGLSVESVRVGQKRRALPAGAELVGYRVVQEAFTNVLKHAGPGVSVRLLRAWDARGLTIEVDDDGRGAAADETGAVGGQGIRGMRERVGLYNGSVEVGPRRGGGFRVAVHIPYGGS